MSETGGFDRILENVGPGPETVTLGDLAGDSDLLLVLLQRDHYCTNCREQVQAVKHRYDEFAARDTAVVSVVPEPRHRVAAWQDRYDLPFPLLADPDAAVGDAFDQPVRFGLLGSWSDFLGRMPAAVLVDGRDGDPDVVWVERGRSTFDRPSVDDLLGVVDGHRGGVDGGPPTDGQVGADDAPTGDRPDAPGDGAGDPDRPGGD
jgi:peroxiredoxin Q/BCP